MKRIVSVLILLIMAVSVSCYGAGIYPPNVSDAKPEITERINIIFDNSGHDDVKKMIEDVFLSTVVAENSEIWLYPIAGSNPPIKIEPTKEFIEKYFNTYAKTSNEFKPENVIETAITDMMNDTSVSSKRIVLYVNLYTYEMREEYNYRNALQNYLEMYPDMIFTTVYSMGSMDMYASDYRNYSNYEVLDDKNLHEFLLIKNGYSPCDAVFDMDNYVLKIEKGKGNNNLFVIAFPGSPFTAEHFKDKYEGIFLGGCVMNEETYLEYPEKSKLKGVALSYNHVIFDHVESDVFDTYNNDRIAAALYTLDGKTIDPNTDNLYIPVIGAANVTVYQKESKGAGVCSAETTYNAETEKRLIEKYSPEQPEEQPVQPLVENYFEKTAPKQSIGSKILHFIGMIIGFIFRLIRLLIFIFIILLIVNRKLRSYVQLKILGTKFGPSYEKLVIKIKKMIKEISGAGTKIKGNTDLNCKYIFISKASADMIVPNNRVELVVKELEKRGIKCWLSETGIKPGQDYNVILPEAIKKCALFLLFVSPMSVKSSDVVSEIGTAKEYKKTIIPVQIEPFDLFKDFPNWAYMLKQYQKTDLFKTNAEEISALANYIEQTFNEIE